MKKHGFRSIFSLLLAVMMVCSMLPTAAFAEGDAEGQSVVVGPEGTPAGEPKQDEVKLPEGGTPEEPKQDEVKPPEGGTPEEPKQDEVKPPEDETSQGPAKSADPAPSDAVVPGSNRLTVSPMPNPDPTPAAFDTGHKIDVTFTVLYVGDEFKIGYNYGSSEKTKFVCQYTSNHSDTAYSNHTIAISDIKAAADRASVNSGYQIVGWSKESNANPTTWPLNKSGTTACNKGTTIYLVAKKPVVNTNYSFTLIYDGNAVGVTNIPATQTHTQASTADSLAHQFTIPSTVPVREGYEFKGWSTTSDGGVGYTANQPYSMTATRANPSVTATLYAVWEKKAPTPPSVPTDKEIGKALSGKVYVVVSCVTENSDHPLMKYPLFAYVSGLTKPNPNEVTANSDGTYSYTVSFLASNFVKMYSQAAPIGIGSDHELADTQDLRTVTLTWKDSTIGWTATTQNINVSAKCEEQQPEGPSEITDGDLEALLKGALKIECMAVEGHVKLYDVKKEDVRSKNVSGNNCEITFDATPYFGKFIGEFGQHSSATDESLTKVITLKWVDGKWVATNTPIIHKVVCVPEIDPPEKPTPPTDEIGGATVAVKCITGHGDLSWKIGSSTFTVGEVTGDDTTGYTCTVTVRAEVYVNAFNSNKKANGVKHTLADDAEKTFTMTYVNGAWTGPTNPAVTFEVKCETEQPEEPDAPDISTLQVNVHCKTLSDVHGNGWYYLPEGTTPERINGYTYQVAIPAKPYVDKYNEAFPGHTLDDEDSKTITLTWDADAGKWVASPATYVTFDVECIPAPNISMLQVQVHCVTPNSSHMDEFYDLPEDTTLEYVDANTRRITVQAAPYVEQYGNGHKLADGESESKTITATWDGVKWNFDATSVTFYVKCETQPEVPGDITDEDLAKLKVVIHCTTNGSHTDRTYDLIAGTYRRDDSNDGGFTCYIAVLAAPYVNEYISDTGTNHELVDPQKSSKTITLRWNTETKAWAADSNSVTFDVKCTTQEGPAQKYTVTYTDGVDGVEIFKDQVYADLTAGTATPKFNGTPTRVGYFFAGWNPAVADTVTGNATYTASWKVDSNNNGKPDDEEERYTVTYLDGANGRAFASQVYPGLLSGTATPKFNGTPVRSGYVFIGWSPVWSGTVTGNVTYTATWSTITGGLDKVPKTGDNGLTLALSALLLLSFCGAAACVVSTKKRG